MISASRITPSLIVPKYRHNQRLLVDMRGKGGHILQPNEVFVFGSNKRGIHGGGAALTANLYFGAIPGKGVGRAGQSYAIPTKATPMERLSINEISEYVDDFITYATTTKDIFLVTEVGCGLAGHSAKDIAPLFRDAIPHSNIHLPQSFWDILNADPQ